MAKKTERKPTVDKIQGKFKAYERYYQKLHDDQKEVDEYYELTFDADVPSEYPERKPDTARNWVDAGVRNYTLDNPRAKVYLRNDSDAARNQVATMETFYNFFLRLYIITIKRAAKKLLKRGEAFLNIGMDDTYFGTQDEERLFHFPLFLRTPDAINTYASPAHNGLVPHDVIEKFDITVAEAKAMCEERGWNWKTNKTDDKLVSWMTYYDANWRCFLLDGESVLTPAIQPNILGFCPYVHIDAGVGDESYEGKPEYQYRSIIWPRKDMLKLEVRNLSQTDAILGRYAWGRYKATLANPGDDVIKQVYPDGKIPTDPSKWLIDIEGRLKTEILKGEEPPAGLFTQLAMVRDYSSPPSVLSGIRPTGVYSGQHQETILATAKPMYKDPFKNLEDGLGVTMGMGARIIEKVYNYPVQIKNFADEDARAYRQIKPSDIKGHYDCEVQLLAEPPEATDTRKVLGKGLRQGGSISHKTELRNYHDMSEKEAEDEQAQIQAEEAMQQPAVQAVVAKDAMKRLGMEQQLEELEQAEQMAKQKVVKGSPPIPQGEGISTEGIRTRGRVSPSLEAIPTPKEEEIEQRLAQ